MTLPWAVYLFDVDGTLISASGAGRRAFERAVGDHCEAPDGRLAALRLDGMTDRLIVRETMRLLGRPFDDALCDALLARYVEHLRTEIHGPGYAVLPGVVESLEALRARGALVALCTGNVVEGARLKLARGGLDAYFDWATVRPRRAEARSSAALTTCSRSSPSPAKPHTAAAPQSK